MKRKRQHTYLSSSKGFTLLEMLIALSLVSIIAVILMGALHLGIRAWEKGESIAQNQRSHILLDRIRRQLSGATFVDSNHAGAARTNFKGDHQTIEFISTKALDPSFDYGWVEVRYIVDNGPDGIKRLRIFERLYERPGNPIDRRLTTDKDFIEWVSGFEALRFDFLDPPGRATSLQWRPVWRSQGKHKLPDAVRVTYSAEGAEPFRVIARILRDT